MDKIVNKTLGNILMEIKPKDKKNKKQPDDKKDKKVPKNKKNIKTKPEDKKKVSVNKDNNVSKKDTGILSKTDKMEKPEQATIKWWNSKSLETQKKFQSMNGKIAEWVKNGDLKERNFSPEEEKYRAAQKAGPTIADKKTVIAIAKANKKNTGKEEKKKNPNAIIKPKAKQVYINDDKEIKKFRGCITSNESVPMDEKHFPAPKGEKYDSDLRIFETEVINETTGKHTFIYFNKTPLKIKNANVLRTSTFQETYKDKDKKDTYMDKVQNARAFVPKNIRSNIPDDIRKNFKGPIMLLDLLDRMASSRMLTAKSPGLNFMMGGEVGGKGTINSQCGEIISLVFMGLDDKHTQKLYEYLMNQANTLAREDILANPRLKHVMTAEWIVAGLNNKIATFNHLKDKYPDINLLNDIECVFWDNNKQATAAGWIDPEKNKEDSTDGYIKIRYKGNAIFEECSMKKDIIANLNNGSTGDLTKGVKSIEGTDVDSYVFVKKQSKHFKDFYDKKAQDKVNEYVKKYPNSKSVKELSSVLKEKGMKSVNEAFSEKGGSVRDKQRVMDTAMEVLKEHGVTKNATRAEKELARKADSLKKLMDKEDRDYDSALCREIKNNKELHNKVLDIVRNKLPLAGVFDGREYMAIGENVVDINILKKMFGVETWHEVKEKLDLEEVKDRKGGVSGYKVVYKADTKKGDTFDVSTIVSRANGNRIGGHHKFEIKINKNMGDSIINTNKELFQKDPCWRPGLKEQRTAINGNNAIYNERKKKLHDNISRTFIEILYETLNKSNIDYEDEDIINPDIDGDEESEDWKQFSDELSQEIEKMEDNEQEYKELQTSYQNPKLADFLIKKN